MHSEKATKNVVLGLNLLCFIHYVDQIVYD